MQLQYRNVLDIHNFCRYIHAGLQGESKLFVQNRRSDSRHQEDKKLT